ncbi:hypothetical protein NDU88_001089 [Pleurodeles waltl]|uniref:Uncharacterized protein n=1 Tax=Pleurodeles waltl TaxID=8319 RepID=A0AAV7R8Q3_PLEWA|nr:hypothetical protein NDU88_001089 [Pleurodeles waltl]
MQWRKTDSCVARQDRVQLLHAQQSTEAKNIPKMFVECCEKMPAPLCMNTQRQTGLQQTAASVHIGLPRTAAANRSGVSPRSKAAEKEMNVQQRQTQTGTSAQQEPLKGGRKHRNQTRQIPTVGPGLVAAPVKTRPLVASVKMRKHVKCKHSFISLPPTQDRAVTLDAHSVQLPQNLLCSSLTHGTLMK